jgi:acetolactate synthase-1/2/3 large subunit
MWVAQAYPFSHPRTLLTSGGLGTMGFGLPAAIGAALANPDRRVVCISGDGSIFMNIQEFATLKELDLNITIIIMNNKHLGLVRQQQEMFYNGNIYACKFDIDFDFVRIARAFDIKSYDLGQSPEPALLLLESLQCSGPCLVNIPIHYSEKVLPIVPPGEANRNMIAEVKHLVGK